MVPTFIVAGATKSGTTALGEYLNDHPQVCMSWMKEPNFFTEEIPVTRYKNGFSWYQSLFDKCGQAKAIGEVSPAYMPRKDAPKLIARYIPGVQLLFMLRNPLERIYSHYRYAQQRGMRLPSLEEMVKTDHPELKQAVNISSYHKHLDRYLKSFPKEQISIFIYEEFRADLQQSLRYIYHVIGVDPDFTSPNLGRLYNPSQEARLVWLQYSIDKYGRKLMVKKMPAWIYKALRGVRDTAWKLNSKDAYFSKPSLNIEKALSIKVTDSVSFVEEYLERRIPAWHDK
jgi:hypothetical protein